jgi:Sigma-70 region 2
MATPPLSKVVEYLRRAAYIQEGPRLTDEQLLGAFLDRREDAAFEAMVRRHGAMVFGVCRRILHDRHDAEDAFQATFMVFIRKSATIGNPDRLAQWLYGVANRSAWQARARLGSIVAGRRAKLGHGITAGKAEKKLDPFAIPNCLPILWQSGHLARRKSLIDWTLVKQDYFAIDIVAMAKWSVFGVGKVPRNVLD